MTLADLGNLGEFVGSIAVVITLVYLIIQLRQNTTELKQTSADIRQTGMARLTEMHSRHRFFIASEKEVAALISQGLENYVSIDAIDKTRFDHFMWDVMLAYLLIWTRIQDGIMDEGHWEFAQTDFINQWVGKPGGRDWWNTTDVFIPEGFKSEIDAKLR